VSITCRERERERERESMTKKVDRSTIHNKHSINIQISMVKRVKRERPTRCN